VGAGGGAGAEKHVADQGAGGSSSSSTSSSRASGTTTSRTGTTRTASSNSTTVVDGAVVYSGGASTTSLTTTTSTSCLQTATCLDAINLCTALHRIAKLSANSGSKNGYTRTRLLAQPGFQTLLDLVALKIPEFTARGTANVLYALAKLKFGGEGCGLLRAAAALRVFVFAGQVPGALRQQRG
ncbi:unnamed protein product, partial [Amoebophrya sp. A120]